MGSCKNTSQQITINMKLLGAALALSMVPLVTAFPAGDSPYLTVKVSGPGGSYGTNVSKQQVELESNGEVKYEPHYPHVPPFTAFRKTPYQPPEPVYRPAPKVKAAPAPPPKGS